MADPTKAPTASWLDRAAAWCERHPHLLLVLVLLLAAVVRARCWLELRGTAPTFLHLHTEMDSAFFDAWGHRIASGDPWTDVELHPVHTWHAMLADRLLAAHPERVPGFDPASATPEQRDAAHRAFWNGWYGGKRFHQEPLYPYLLGALYALGLDAHGVYVLQLVVGVGNVLLLWWIAKRTFGVLAAALAGAFAALCPPIVLYDFLLLRTTWIVAAGFLLVLAFERARESPRARRWLGCGLLLGAAVALKTTFAMFGAVAALIAWWPGRRDAGAWRRILLLGAGGLIAVSPFLLRNAVVGAPLLSLTSVGPITFLVSNQPTFGKDLGWNVLPEVADLLARTDGSFSGAVRTAIGAHDGLLGWLAFLCVKLERVWHWFEIPNNANLYHFGLYSPTLVSLPVRFGWIAPLGLLGVVLALSRGRGVLLAWLALSTLIPMVAFYALSRFRVPMLAALLPFAAFALLELLRHASARRWVLLCLLGVPTLLFALWQHRPIDPPSTPLIREFRYRVDYLNAVEPIVRDHRAAGDEAGALAVLQRFFDKRPDWVDRIDRAQPPASDDQIGTSLVFSSVHGELAVSLARLGDPDGARTHRARYEELRAAARIAADRLGVVLELR